MEEKGLKGYFKEFLNQKSLFNDKSILQSNHTPETITHRDGQIKKIASILAPCLKGQRPSNVFIYGKTGTGKTLTITYTTQELSSIAKEQNVNLKTIFLNCKLKKIADTEYRLIAQLARELGKAIPPTGLPTDEVYNIFYSTLDKEKKNYLLILDEIDSLVDKVGDELLYNLTRINTQLKNSQISIVGVSNNLSFTEHLDPRVKSSLSEEEIIFPPYNAMQIQDILRQRSEKAFNEGCVKNGVIEKCAAYAAREHGDARRAIELLRVAGELAEREGADKVMIEHLDKAEEKMEKDRLFDTVLNQPTQFQATYYSILVLSEKRRNNIFTGEIYELYRNLCSKIGLRPLTQRRISDIISEMDMFGLINAKIISKGRYGRMREISLSTTEEFNRLISKKLEEGLELA